jgi:ribosomal protein S18 acetylase RimI-like enzyme
MVIYTDSLQGITPDNLNGFFVGWPNPPSPETHFQILEKSDEIFLAIDDETGNVVGFITAITDEILSAFIPLLEVLPDHQNQGIGQQLTRRMLDKVNRLYQIDLMCDQKLQSFYARFKMKRATGMTIRNFDKQSGCG